MVKIGDKFLIIDENNPSYIGKIGEVGEICDDYFTFFLDDTGYSDHDSHTLEYEHISDISWITIIPLCPAIKTLYGVKDEI